MLAILLTIGVASAQTTTIKGKVISVEDNLSVIGATVYLNFSDSAKRTLAGRVVTTDVNGQFTITSREKKSDITINFLGFKEHFTVIPEGQKVVNLGTILLEPQAVGIDAVVVTGQATMAKIKGDTIQFNATSFKTNPDATAEDLIKKMPGVSTESDGTVSSQGQKIAKILVNGKEYFDNDPSMALKSLPSDAVESVQMFDDQTDEARFSGMDDGERVRTINIVTKKGTLNSIFGRAWVGYGTDQRYSTGVLMNIFNDTQRWTISAGSNNVNNQGFSMADMGGSGRSGRGMMRAEGVSTGSFMTSASGGINQSSNIGLNYNGTFGDKLKLTAQYSYGNVNADKDGRTTKNYLDRERYESDSSRVQSFDNRHNLRIRTEWTPNAKNKINFNPTVSYGLNHGYTGSTSEILNGIAGPLEKDALNAYARKYESYEVRGDLWWQHAFAKAGRTMSLGAQTSVSKSMGNNLQVSKYNTMTDGLLVPDSINRIGDLVSSGYSLTGSATYSEPISKSSKISANYNINYNRTIADQKGMNWDDICQQYAFMDTATTNYLNRNYTTQTAGVAYSYTKGKNITLNAGLDYLFATQNNNQTQLWSGNVNSKFSFQAFQPSIRLRMTPAQGQNLNVDLRMYSGFPSITQLQDVLDVSNPLSVRKGNPNLEQSTTAMFRVHYNIANTAKNTNFNFMLMGNLTDNNISSNQTIIKGDTTINGTQLTNGTSYTTYVNLNGARSAFMFAEYNFGIKPIKSIMNVRLNYRYSRQPSMQNDLPSITNGNTVGATLSLTSNISENVDFTFRYNPSISLSEPTRAAFNRYFTHNFSGFLNLYLTRNLFINVDASWNNNFGTQENSAQHFTLLNAAIGYKFLKSRQAEFKIQGYDLLNQNRSYYQSAYENYIQTNTNYEILKRYFMVSFTYKFDTRKNRATATNSSRTDDSDSRRAPMGGMNGMGGGRH